ncbi:unnamed protein product, partial [Adineta ricciae]
LQQFPCQLSYEATTLGYEGVALVIEDYDPVTNETYSSIPLQFLIRIVDQIPVTVPPDFNYTGAPLLQPCTVPPVYIGDRHHGACIGVKSNSTVIERIVIRVPCNESSTTITDILTVSPPGMSKSSISLDPDDNNTYIMYIQWTPRPDQYGIHQLCLTPVDSVGQTGQQVCYTFQVDVEPPNFINGSMTPQGLVPRNQAIWSISTDQDVIPPSQRVAYIRYFKQMSSGADVEVLRVNVALDVIYQARQLVINTGSTTWEEGAQYYILFDSGIALINQSCGIESAPLANKYFWTFQIAAPNNTTQTSTTRKTTTTTTHKTTTTTHKTTTTTHKTTITTTHKTTTTTATKTPLPSITTTTTTAGAVITSGIPLNGACPNWLPFGTVLSLTSSALQPNYTFCFTVNTTFADVTIAANTWAPCSTWKISGTADPLL